MGHSAHLYANPPPWVTHYWIVDPDARTLEALSLVDTRWVAVGAWDESMTARIAPFEAVELPIGRLFLPRAPVTEEP